MTSQQADQQPEPSRHWARRETLIAVIVAVVIGGVGGAAIYAATQDSHGLTGGMHGPQHWPQANGPGAPAGLGGPGAPGGPPPPQGDPAVGPGVLHSEYVVADGNGGFLTKMSQTGTVDEITPSSIVVRSDDGFTQIYEFSASNAPNPAVAPNDTVTVAATRTGPTVTLNSIEAAPR